MYDAARKALLFYANPANWVNETVDIGVGEQEIPQTSNACDGGETARKALAALDAQPREPLDVDELAQFIRTTDGNHTMGAGALAESIVRFLAKRHERGEEV